MGESADKINAQLQQIVPELKSKYAIYPIAMDRWYNFDEKSPDGKPIFISSEKDTGLKMDYVYCSRGPQGKGYYHLLTKIAYVNLYNYVGNQAVGCCGSGDKTDADAHAVAKRIIYARSQARRPDDVVAREDAVMKLGHDS